MRVLKPLSDFGARKTSRDGLKGTCRRCDSDASIRQRANNLERAREREREYAKANRERLRATKKRWKKNNPEKVKADGHNQWLKNTEKLRERARATYRANKDRYAANAKAWVEANAEAYNEYKPVSTGTPRG